MNTILYRNKELRKSGLVNNTPIYKGETNVDIIRFLVDTSVVNYSDFYCIMQTTLPDGENGALRYLTFEDEIYKDHYLKCDYPIQSYLTQQVGRLKISLRLINYNPDDDTYQISTTGDVYLDILNSNIVNDTSFTEEEEDTLVKLQKQIDILKDEKISSIAVNAEDNTLSVYSDKDKTKLIATVDLPEEVYWQALDDDDE